LEDAVHRVAKERLGTSVPNPKQVGTVGGPDRDSKRAKWALSVVYRSTVNPADLNLAAGKRIERLQWTDLAQLSVERNFAFDHRALILHAAEQLRQEVSELKFPAGLIPHEFTLGELQTLAEHVLGRRLDKSSFRRRIAERDLLRTVEGSMRTGANRPAQLFQFK
jgi:ADP-ribose pyrophosphatase YjhB (NUDIX family)